MKRILPLFCAIIFFNFSSKAQYSAIWAAYPTGYELTCGFATQATPGCLWFGYMPTVQNISTTWHVNKNFCIMGSGQSSIWGSYQIFEAPNCVGTPTQVLNGYGVSAIETNGPNNLTYAVTGSYNKACYFAALDQAGQVITAVSYPFPSAISNQYPLPAKPLIIECNLTKSYFIAGNFEGNMYVIKIGINGNIIWSNFYSLGGNVMPKDIIMNPYQKGRLMIVGELKLSSGDEQAFLCNLDGNNGSMISTNIFGTSNTYDGFNTIIEASGAGLNNGNGFVIGGYTGSNPNQNGNTNAWVLKLDPSGNAMWSRLQNPTMGTNYGVVDVIERKNTNNIIEYYALLKSTVGMQVLKLDVWGNPFPPSGPTALYNEFAYDIPALLPAKAVNITYVNNPAVGANVGIQVFGNASNFPGYSSSYLANAFFNGETNCYRTLTTMQNPDQGPSSSSSTTVTTFGSFSACTNFYILAFFPGGSISYPCSGPNINGSNERSMPSGIDPNVDLNENFSVFPNPTNNKTTANYTVSDNEKVSIEVYSLLGKLVYKAMPEPKLAGTYQEEIDFESLSIEKGVYLLVTNVGGRTHQQKIVYSK